MNCPYLKLLFCLLCLLGFNHFLLASAENDDLNLEQLAVVNLDTSATFCAFDTLTCAAQINIPVAINAPDFDSIGLSAFLDLSADGSNDIDLTDSISFTNFPSFEINFTAPIGVHAIEIFIESDSIEFIFAVADCKAPSFVCLGGMAVELLPTDIDGDGDIDEAAIEVQALDFVVDSTTDCSMPIIYSINRNGELPNQAQGSLMITCDDYNTLIVEIYAWDSAYNPYMVQPDGSIGGPNYTFCLAYVIIQDNALFHCGDPSSFATAAGVITTENEEGMAGIELQLEGPLDTTTDTDDTGAYAFTDLELFYNYSITPHLDEEHNNGVSTFDIVLLSKHILGTSPLDSPYKIIAGDVNNSGSISTFDMVLIRRIVLTIDTEFELNTSWRFVPADYVFPDPKNPWFEPFPESIELEDLNGDNHDLNFIAIKVGDVNNSAN